MCLPVCFECGLDLGCMFVSVQPDEEIALVVDFAIIEVATTTRIVAFAEGFGSVCWVHGIQEGGGFVIAKVCDGCNVHRRHHFMVLMDQVVAVEHIETVPWSIAKDWMLDML